jgi:hypothetical protein
MLFANSTQPSGANRPLMSARNRNVLPGAK